jgi:ABC-2 type transport system permease protein
MGAMLASLVGPMADQIRSDTQFLATFSAIFPSFDLDSAGGWIQLYAEMLYIAFGFAAATLVAKWASDETDGRLEMLLASPLSRVRWLVAGGIGALLGSAIVSLLFALGIAGGAGSGGIDATDPMIGSAATMLFAWAVVGVGVAVGGLWRASLAADVAALFVVATYLLALVAPPLGLPDWVSGLALTTHFGEPMTGSWDMTGVVASLVIAIGGIALGMWGVRRRDIAR